MNDKLDEILYDALKENDTPSPMLNRQILSKAYLEEKQMKSIRKNIAAAAAITLCVGLAGGGTAYAAYRYLTSSEIAETVSDNHNLADAFESEDAVLINEAQQSGNYVFNFLGLVSGSKLEPYISDDVDSRISQKKTYATVAISMKDGSDMPYKNFCVSPLIGEVPVDVANNGTMGTSLIWFEQDGIIYELVECDDLEIFADRGVWLSVVENFGDEVNAYVLNEQDGSYSKNEAFEGISALFKIPFDESKADKAAADEYIKNLENRTDAETEEADQAAVDLEKFRATLDNISPEEIAAGFDEVKNHTVTSKPDANGYIDLTCVDEEITCGVSGQIEYLIGDDEDFVVLNVFADDGTPTGFTAIYRNDDGSFTFKEFRVK